jgi:hypothetical protein
MNLVPKKIKIKMGKSGPFSFEKTHGNLKLITVSKVPGK